MRQPRLAFTGLALVAVMAGGLWPGAPSAGALTPGAPELAADCNDDGNVVVTKESHYHGGTGMITRDCRVTIEHGARLVLTKVTLLSKCCFFVISPSGHDSEVLVIDSKTDLAGALQLVSGCCAGEPWEANGHVRVERSYLVASSIEVGTSVNNPNGRVEVIGSRLRTTKPAIAPSINIWASYGDFGGVDGTAFVSDSELISADRIRIATGPWGSTSARSNRFTAPGGVVVTTGPGGFCATLANVPAVACS